MSLPLAEYSLILDNPESPAEEWVVGEMNDDEELSNFFGDACFEACVSNTVNSSSQTAFKKDGVSSILSEVTLAGTYKPWRSMTRNKSINPFLERKSFVDAVVDSSMFRCDIGEEENGVRHFQKTSPIQNDGGIPNLRKYLDRTVHQRLT